MKLNVSRLFFAWLPFVVTITLVALFVYGASQQVLRSGANDPQIQIVEDAARALSQGTSPHVVISSVPSTLIEISLAPFVAVYDSSGVAIVSSGTLHGKMPMLPSGVLSSVLPEGESRVTWQPESGVRQAIVVRHFVGTTAGYVVAGRSLRDVEIRVQSLLVLVEFGWLVSLCVTLFAVGISEYVRSSAVTPV